MKNLNITLTNISLSFSKVTKARFCVKPSCKILETQKNSLEFLRFINQLFSKCDVTNKFSLSQYNLDSEQLPNNCVKTLK